MKKVAVGISGGVDSAVAAKLLLDQGFEVTGVHLYCWPPKSEKKMEGCRAEEDRAFALKTALEIGIPFKVLDFSEEYNSKVVKYFYDEYEAGRTPNPDVMCNSEIKFGLFLKWALENGFDYIATGHYARLVDDSEYVKNRAHTKLCRPDVRRDTLRLPGTGCARFVDFTPASSALGIDIPLHRLTDTPAPFSFRLYIPKDKHKDQTYFLWKLTQKELAHTLFPLGDLEKSEVRKLAEEAKLTVAKRKDSQGICFVGNVPAREFLARRLKKKIGKVVNLTGEEVGKHDGVWFYTIGQRGGWEILPAAQGKFSGSGVTPVFYVIGKDAKKNILTVARENEANGDKFEVNEINIISDTAWNLDNLIIRIRHGGELMKAHGMETKSGLKIVLEKAVRGIASGQSAVFYSEDGECLGGGVIA